ncbi:MAG: hypothetical protein FWB91_06605 [Defluviitaleaceae bacterium]|nr:hypothetical protein [Defluviitaleaceae bacterium]
MEREEIDVTDLDSDGGFREFITGFIDPGSVALSGNAKYDKDTGLQNEGQRRLRELFLNGNAAQFEISWPNVPEKCVFDALVQSAPAPEAEVDGVLSFAATLRMTGKVDFVPVTVGQLASVQAQIDSMNEKETTKKLPKGDVA